jgi:hypothetical protein
VKKIILTILFTLFVGLLAQTALADNPVTDPGRYRLK